MSQIYSFEGRLLNKTVLLEIVMLNYLLEIFEPNYGECRES